MLNLRGCLKFDFEGRSEQKTTKTPAFGLDRAYDSGHPARRDDLPVQAF